MITSQSVLITGGSSGIGFGLARRFHDRGDRVIITGRDAGRLDAAERRLPGLRTIGSDIASSADREALAAYVVRDFPELDLLINNAGVQRRVALAEDGAPWSERQAELDALLSGPVHLNHLLILAMLTHSRPSTIVNVSSGGALIPQPFAPLYSAAKAALHSYTTTLRHALAGTGIDVLELIPPAVATGLSGSPHPHGADVDQFCDAAFAGITARRPTIGFGPTDTPAIRERLAAEQEAFDAGSTRFPVATYRAAR